VLRLELVSEFKGKKPTPRNAWLHISLSFVRQSESRDCYLSVTEDIGHWMSPLTYANID